LLACSFSFLHFFVPLLLYYYNNKLFYLLR